MTGQETTAELLGCFIADCAWEKLPDKVVEHSKDCTLDIIGCMVSESREHSTTTATGALHFEEGSPHSTVVCYKVKTSVTQAAFLYATLGHIYDFDDDHLEAALHPSTVVFPTVKQPHPRWGWPAAL